MEQSQLMPKNYQYQKSTAQVNNKVVNSGAGAIKTFRISFFYNSAVQSTRVDAALTCNFKRNNKESGERLQLNPGYLGRALESHNDLKK